MIKRATWFVAGAVSGAVGAAWAYTRVRDTRGPVAANQLADSVVSASRRVGTRVRDAVSEGVDTMRETQAQLDDTVVQELPTISRR